MKRSEAEKLLKTYIEANGLKDLLFFIENFLKMNPPDKISWKPGEPRFGWEEEQE